LDGSKAAAKPDSRPRYRRWRWWHWWLAWAHRRRRL